MFWKVEDIAAILERRFPLQLAESWDNPGLQIGSRKAEVQKALVALDLDQEVAGTAISLQASLIITHHPFIFRPIKSIVLDNHSGQLIAALLANNIAAYCAHTNLDAAPDGLNDWLAQALGLAEVRTLPGTSQQRLYKLIVYVPELHESGVREALSRAGAGHTGNYSDCSFRTAGIGTFRPGIHSQPFIGARGQLEEVAESRLETVVGSLELGAALEAIRMSHPYEEPAYDIIALENPSEQSGLGRIGGLFPSLSLKEFGCLVRASLKLDSLRLAGDMNRHINKVAVISGSGSSFISNALAAGADVLVTGDIKYHEARDAAENGLALIDAGHYGTEIIMARRLAEELNQKARIEGVDTRFIPFENRNCFIEINSHK